MSEEVRPVAWRVRMKDQGELLRLIGDGSVRWNVQVEKPEFASGWDEDDFIVEPLYLAPAPDKLALAVEALEKIANMNVIDPGGLIVGLERWHFDRARQALSAIKASD